jgi:hypothetical protein
MLVDLRKDEEGISTTWPYVFYVFGAAGMIWWLGWQYLVASTPDSHPSITEAEKAYLAATVKEDADIQVEKVQVEKSESAPWLAFFTTPAAWALYVNHFASGWGAYTLMTYLPKYMKERLGFDMAKAGFLAVLPYILQWLAYFVSGTLADHLIATRLSVRSTRLLLEFVGFGMAGVLIVAAGYMESKEAAVATVSGELVGLHVLRNLPTHSAPVSGLFPLSVGRILGIAPALVTPPPPRNSKHSFQRVCWRCF